ncbi:YlqD family protein [Listeria sp. PSOL-1]|uniref:YlqD family protein n=1 Tax=Listeria sp. PSOL-1 TaxID=1844999 RepID=UPI0013CF4E67|nr:YlqD family protein [Listeria sp. PSOL-1]
MKIIQKITVKQVLTKQSKAKLLTYYNEQKRMLQQESDQLHFERKKVERKNKYNLENITEYFERELNLRHEKMKLVDFQMDQLEVLPLGSEVREREIEALIEVNVGDVWNDTLFDKTIVVTDEVVTEIR